MPAWILLAIASYLLMALSQTIDKAFLQVVFQESRAFACLVGLLGMLAFALLPWTGGAGLTLGFFLLSLLAGAFFVAALLPFFSALQRDDATRVIPLVGALVPICTLLLETLVFGLPFGQGSLLAFLLLTVGAVVLTLSPSKGRRHSWAALVKGALAAVMFASSFVISKYVFSHAPFLTAFVWMRLGGLVVSVALLGSREVRAELSRVWRQSKTWVFGAYLGNQALAGVGFLLQSLAISLGTASLVSAMQGVQYFFIILFVVIAARFRPSLLEERITKAILFEKITAMILVAAGLMLLAL